MKQYLKIAAVAVLVVVAVTAFILVSKSAGSGGKASPSPSPSISESPSPSPSPSPSVSPSPSPVYENPLTGLPIDAEAVNNRPYAIMLNNLITAQPLLGISKADILFEIPVEGGITRLMGLFQDVDDAGRIGSVRSARPYFIDIALGYDAVYIHAGGSPQAYERLKASGIVHLDGVNGSKQDIFFRDPERRKTMGYEHSLVTSGELISKFLPTYGIRLDHPEGVETGMTFKDDPVLTGGQESLGVTVHFSGSKKTAFEYDRQTGLYKVSQFNKAYNDGVTGQQLAVKNVLVLKTKIYNIAGDTSGRLTVDVTGSGTGAVWINGSYAPIKWSKKSAASPYTFTFEDGTPLVFAKGATYICVVSGSDKLDIA